MDFVFLLFFYRFFPIEIDWIIKVGTADCICLLVISPFQLDSSSEGANSQLQYLRSCVCVCVTMPKNKIQSKWQFFVAVSISLAIYGRFTLFFFGFCFLFHFYFFDNQFAHELARLADWMLDFYITYLIALRTSQTTQKLRHSSFIPMVHICYFDLSFISDFGAVFFLIQNENKKLILTAPKIIPTETPKATFNQFWPFNDFTYYHIWRGLTDYISGLYVKHLVFSFSWNADVRYFNFQLC